MKKIIRSQLYNKYIELFASGNIKKTAYFDDDGKFHGLYREWFPNGILSKEFYLKNGIKHGRYRLWYDDGKIQTDCYYNNGLLHGRYREWSVNFSSPEVYYLETEAYYAYGEILRWKEWHQNGQIATLECNNRKKYWDENGHLFDM